jgi:hypothetical protein
MSEPNTQYILAAITPIVEALEQLGVNYHISQGRMMASCPGCFFLLISLAEMLTNYLLRELWPPALTVLRR